VKRFAHVVALLLAGACFDHLLVAPERNIEPRLHVTVQVLHDEAARYVVLGSFTPGSDSTGKSRVMIDSTMKVADSSISGLPSSDLEELSYSWIDSTTLLVRDTLAVRGPTLESQASATATLLIRMPARADARLTMHTTGDDLRLHISTFAEAPYGFGADFGSWSLEINDARQNVRLLTLQGRSAPASTQITIPGQLLPTVAGDSLVAKLQYGSSFTSVLAAYPTFLHIFANLTWHVRVVAAPP
jgi:hypothetical protein